MIATPLEGHLVDHVADALPSVNVLFDPALLPPTRFPCDHRGVTGFTRNAAGEERWNAMLGEAEVLFGIPLAISGRAWLATVPRAPRLRWIQGTAAGAGETVRAAALAAADLQRITFTSAAAVHGGMLAEFAFYGLLALRKDAQRLERYHPGRTRLGRFRNGRTRRL